MKEKTKQFKNGNFRHGWAFWLFFLAILLITIPAYGQSELCQGLVFSTEEDFVTQGPEPPDGNPIISDGDLLSLPDFPGTGRVTVCARNRELLRIFEPRADLGLDAVDVIEPGQRMIAFSTDLDDPQGRFTAGDLLTTTGAILPNSALTAQFKLPKGQDIGLDAVQFVGEKERIIALLERIKAAGRERFVENPELLIELLTSLEVDIHFSTEGTGPGRQGPSFLDGDLLSARNGNIVVSNGNFLPGLPAGIPTRGVDYGLDAFTVGSDPIENVSVNLFSTEIVSLDPSFSFTDGDILIQGGGIFLKNFDLIKPLEPRALDLGLDALDMGAIVCEENVRITHLWEISVGDLSSNGLAPKDAGSITDLTVNDRPFGNWVKIIGDLPCGDCLEKDLSAYEFRLEFQPAGGSWQPILTPDHANPDPKWKWEVPAAWPPGANLEYKSDAEGWISLADYCRTHAAFQTLNAWNTRGKEGEHQLRLTLREIGAPGTALMSPVVPVFLDNTSPHNHSNRPDIVLQGEFEDQCDIPADERDIEIVGEIRDEHFLSYALHWHGDGGGLSPIDSHFYDEGLSYLNGKGTVPAGSNVLLGSITIPTGIDCGFIRLRAQDRTIVGSFNAKPPGLIDLLHRNTGEWDGYDWESFCFRAE